MAACGAPAKFLPALAGYRLGRRQGARDKPQDGTPPRKGFAHNSSLSGVAPWLAEALELAPEGSEFVVERFRARRWVRAGWRGCNLRTTFEKIIGRAGLTVWPRLFHNLRASRETELMERFPIQVVTAWLGNTPSIALKHYLQVTDQHFQAALDRRCGGGAESGAATVGNARNDRQGEIGQNEADAENPEKFEVFRECATPLGDLDLYQLGYTSGWGGIRTPGGLSPTAVFKTAAIVHSATHPKPCVLGLRPPGALPVATRIGRTVPHRGWRPGGTWGSFRRTPRTGHSCRLRSARLPLQSGRGRPCRFPAGSSVSS